MTIKPNYGGWSKSFLVEPSYVQFPCKTRVCSKYGNRVASQRYNCGIRKVVPPSFNTVFLPCLFVNHDFSFGPACRGFLWPRQGLPVRFPWWCARTRRIRSRNGTRRPRSTGTTSHRQADCSPCVTWSWSACVQSEPTCASCPSLDSRMRDLRPSTSCV